jgi:alginate O-acetyltransferase complex protein AlgI
MLFCSCEFLVFFLLVFFAYWALPWHRLRVLLLLGASYYFYASWNKWLALIIFASTTLDYFVARGIDSSASPRRRKALVFVSVVANLGLLCYFKYANFFLHSLESALRTAGASASLPVLRVLLPIGISFYTFETINYVVDVYRRHTPAERDLPSFLLFILFFPHLIAGPIVRARDFLPQIHRRKHFSWLRLEVGVRLFLLGLFKKFVVADRMALFVDPVFADPDAFRLGAVWIALFAYALQIYCDFSGYTDMALGTAHMLGYKLALNFNMPYLSANVSDFWRRWHISLSSWLRDYLFIPLGGNRGGRWFVHRNLLVTMTLGGLWHGASWTFVVWGVLHGLLLILHRMFQGFCRARPMLERALTTWAGTALRVSTTFLCVCLCWVFFRAQTFQGASRFLYRLVVNNPLGKTEPLAAVGFVLTVVVVALGHGLGQRRLWQRIADRLPAPVLGVSYAALLILALLLDPGWAAPFIYFQF